MEKNKELNSEVLRLCNEIGAILNTESNNIIRFALPIMLGRFIASCENKEVRDEILSFSINIIKEYIEFSKLPHEKIKELINEFKEIKNG